MVIRGFTLLKLLIGVIISGVLALVAVPAYSNYVEKGRGAEAFVNLDAMRAGVLRYQLKKGANPDSLGDLNISIADSEDWSFSLNGTSPRATRKLGAHADTTVEMDLNGSFYGNWPFIP